MGENTHHLRNPLLDSTLDRQETQISLTLSSHFPQSRQGIEGEHLMILSIPSFGFFTHQPLLRSALAKGKIFSHVKSIRQAANALVWLAFVPLATAKLTPDQVQLLPSPAARQIQFSKDIKPIFDASCTQCHGRGR